MGTAVLVAIALVLAIGIYYLWSMGAARRPTGEREPSGGLPAPPPVPGRVLPGAREPGIRETEEEIQAALEADRPEGGVGEAVRVIRPPVRGAPDTVSLGPAPPVFRPPDLIRVDSPAPLTPADTTLPPYPGVPDPPDRVVVGRPRPTTAAEARGVAEFETRVVQRLAAEPAPATPLTGALRFELYDVAWNEPRTGRAVARAAALIGALDLSALHAGNVLIEPLEARQPDVIVERRPGDAEWNFERILEDALNGGADDRRTDAADGGRRIEIRTLTIRDGRVDVRSPDSRYLFESVDAVLPRATLAAPDASAPEFLVRTLATRVIPPGDVPPLPVALSDARVRLPEGGVAFTAAAATVWESEFAEIAGAWRSDAPGLGVEGRLRARRLRFADVDFLTPQLPAEGEAAFVLALEAGPGARSTATVTELVARAPGSEVRGGFAVDFGGGAGVRLLSADLLLDPLDLAVLEPFTGTLPYTGAITGRLAGTAAELRLDAVARLTAPELAEPFTIDLEAAAAWPETGLELRLLVLGLQDVPLAALEPVVPAIPFTGTVDGTIMARGSPADVPLELDVSLAFDEGTATLAGVVDLTGEGVRYDVAGTVTGVPLAAVLADDPPVVVNANYRVEGQGFDPGTMDARFLLEGGFAGWRAQPGDTLLVAGALVGGEFALDRATLRLATLAADAEGRWRFTPVASGGIDYRLVVRDLAPWGPYLPFPGGDTAAGAFFTQGRLAGPIDAPVLAGAAEAGDLELDGWSARTVEAGYRLTFTAPQASIDVDAVAYRVGTPTAGEFDALRLELRQTPPTFAVALTGERPDGGAVELLADGLVLPDGTRQATVQRLELDVEGRRWSLERPAFVAIGPGPDIVVRDFALIQADGEGRLLADGRIAQAANDLRLTAEALPVGSILRLAGQDPIVTGELWLDAAVLGSAESPAASVELRLVEGSFRGLRIVSFEGEAEYRGQRLVADASAALEEGAPVDVRASLPLDLQLTFPPRAALVEQGAIDAALTAESLPLSVLEAFDLGLTDVEGVITAAATVTGTPATPRLEGAIRVRNGAATIAAAEQRYREINADIELEDSRAEIVSFTARSDGTATATGTLLFEPLTDPSADITIAFDGFRPLGVEGREGAAAWGELHVTGPVSAPIVTGDVVLNDGDVEIPTVAEDRTFADDPVLLAQPAPPGETTPEQDPATPGAPPPAPPRPWYSAITLDELRLEAGDDLWVTGENLRAQLEGELVITGERGEFRIFGTLEGSRGTYTLQAGPIVRRFDIVASEVRFFGETPPNPAISVTAVRRIITLDRRQVEIVARIGGTISEPTLALGTPDGTQIPESELLSFILFGQPTFALGETFLPGQALIEQTLVGGLAELAAIELEEVLLADVGLPVEYFRIQPTPGAFPGVGDPALAVGFELAPDVFLTIESGLFQLFGGTDAVSPTWSAFAEWRIDPQWSLTVGFEPVNIGRQVRGLNVALPIVAPTRQFTVDLRRRWTY